MVVEKGPAAGIVRHAEIGAGRVEVETQHVGGAWRELDLAESEVVRAVVVKVDYAVRRGIAGGPDQDDERGPDALENVLRAGYDTA